MPGFANVVATRRPRKNRPWNMRKHLVLRDGVGNAVDENVKLVGGTSMRYWEPAGTD